MSADPGATAPTRRERGRGTRIPRCASARLEALTAALADGDAAATETFWAEVASVGTPLIERLADGDCAVTFLWRDGSVNARPYVLANKLHDRTDPEGSAMAQLPDTDVWHLTYRLPADWRGSYQIGVGRPDESSLVRGPAGKVRGADGIGPGQVDPWNQRRFESGGETKSLAELPAAPAQPHGVQRPDVPAGAISEHEWDGERVWVYTPAVPASVPADVVVVLDGDVWVTELGLPVMLDNLIHDRLIRPAVVAMVASGQREQRLARLDGGTEFLTWLVGPLLDRIAAGWAVDPGAARTTFAGQSLGGLMALRAVLAAPERVGAAIAQSSSLWSIDPAAPEWMATDRHAAVRVWMEVGTDEWVNVGPNEAFAEALTAAGVAVTFRHFSGGHDRACWRGGLADGLIAALAVDSLTAS